jgi:hypothetical protein
MSRNETSQKFKVVNIREISLPKAFGREMTTQTGLYNLNNLIAQPFKDY